MADERLKGIIEIETLLHELDVLLFKLGEVKTAIEAVDGKEIEIDADLEDFEQTLSEMGVLKALSSGGGGGTGTGGGATEAATDAATGGFLSSLKEADIRMTDLHNALAKAVPLILVLIGAMPALIGGLFGLAAAAGAAAAALLGITGIGALGFAMAEGDTIMEGFEEILSDIQDSFLDAFTPLAEQLAPLFRDALDGLGRFFQALADNGDALLMFEQTARDFGQFIIQEFPDFIAFLSDVARAFGPVFSAIADALFDSNLGEGFMNFMADVLPALMDFGALLAAVLPDILAMSIGFLRVANVLMALLEAFFILIDVLPITTEQFGALVAVTLAAASAWFLLNSALLQFVGRAVVSALVAVKTLIVEFVNLITWTYATAGAVSALTTAVTILIGVLTLGIGAVAALGATTAVVGDKFSELTGGVNDASRALRNFDRTSRRVGGARSNAFAPSTTPSRGTLGSGGTYNDVTIEGDATKDETDRALAKLSHRNK